MTPAQRAAYRSCMDAACRGQSWARVFFVAADCRYDWIRGFEDVEDQA